METRWTTPWIEKLANGAAQLRAQARRLVQPGAQSTLAAALDQAHAEFRGCYPEWDQYLFDAHFIRTVVAPMLERSAGPADIDGASLVEAWAAQIAWTSADLRQAHTTALLPAAQRFARLLRRNTLRNTRRDLRRNGSRAQ
jgi:hypothetical protein